MIFDLKVKKNDNLGICFLESDYWISKWSEKYNFSV